MTDLKALREMSLEALKQRSTELVKDRVKLRFKRCVGEMSQTHQFAALRKERARIETIIRERGQTDE